MVKTESNKDKKPRTDKRKNVWKVAEVLAVNPNKTDREIEKETWVSKSAVNRAKAELGQTGAKDETIAYIVGSAKENLKDFSKLMRAKMKKLVKESIEETSKWEYELKEWKDIGISTLVEINKIAKEDMARINVLWGSITDEDWWLKSIHDFTFDSMDGANIAW